MKGITGEGGFYWFLRASRDYMNPKRPIEKVRFVLYLPIAYAKYLYVTYKG